MLQHIFFVPYFATYIFRAIYCNIHIIFSRDITFFILGIFSNSTYLRVGAVNLFLKLEKKNPHVLSTNVFGKNIEGG